MDRSNKDYAEEEIKIKDDINISFIKDKDLIGFWEVTDFINNRNSFNPNRLQSISDTLPLQKLIFTPTGDVYINYKNNEVIKQTKYSKNYIIDLCIKDTLSKYFYQTILGEKYLIIEWKSGDYVYGGIINGYYVLKKEK